MSLYFCSAQLTFCIAVTWISWNLLVYQKQILFLGLLYKGWVQLIHLLKSVHAGNSVNQKIIFLLEMGASKNKTEIIPHILIWYISWHTFQTLKFKLVLADSEFILVIQPMIGVFFNPTEMTILMYLAMIAAILLSRNSSFTSTNGWMDK